MVKWIGKHRRIAAYQPRLAVLPITLVAIALFVFVGGSALSNILRAAHGYAQIDRILSYTLLANIAIIGIGWRRYRTLSHELSTRVTAEREARRLAEFDPLTGCRNRRSLLPALDAMMLTDHTQRMRMVLFVIDLDNFKQINDRYGHVTGDLVLTTVAQRLRAIQPKDSIIARLGGDEFACAVLMPTAHRELVDELARLLIEAVAQPITLPEQDIKVDLTMSIGLVAAHRSELKSPPPAEALLNQADIAMYRAKRQGKNRFVWFEAEMEAELELRRSLERDIRIGIVGGEFVPFYEQQVDLETGELVGFEMLARWQSPTHGAVAPDIFIPIAEEMGIIADLSECLISQAFRDAGSWDPSLTLSVNISPVQLRDSWFAQRILKLLVQHNFPPSRLDIEITESCLHENLDEVRTMILSLRNQGVKISLDDFGTGYASLNQLRDLAFDHLKIDRSFVTGIMESDANQTIVDAILTLGKALDLPVTAEGIESETILEAMQGRGRLRGQGHLYGLPESGEAVRRRLHQAGRLVTKANRELAEPRQGLEDVYARVGSF
jgi:diguanylate cyclase (GGDEF)-like protein